MRNFITVLFVLALSYGSTASADWIFGRASTAKKARREMVGMSKEKILECMGNPVAKDKEGQTEVWTYHAGGDSVKAGTAAPIGRSGTYFGAAKENKRYCDISVVFKKDHVKVVHYSGHTGGLFTGGEQCGYAVENCVD